MSTRAPLLHSPGPLDAPRSEVRAAAALSEPRPSRVPAAAFQKETRARPATLGSLLAAVPVLGVRRLTRIALDLATELELALRCEVAPGRLSLEHIWVEHAATPFERVRMPVSTRQLSAPGARASLREFGVLWAQVLAEKPLYLEESLWIPRKSGQRVLRRRADAEVVYSIGRALNLIAQRCAGGPRAYQCPSQLVADLTKLADLTSRIVARRRSVPPAVSIHSPRGCAPRTTTLPKVLLGGAAPVAQLPRDTGA